MEEQVILVVSTEDDQVWIGKEDLWSKLDQAKTDDTKAANLLNCEAESIADRRASESKTEDKEIFQPLEHDNVDSDVDEDGVQTTDQTRGRDSDWSPDEDQEDESPEVSFSEGESDTEDAKPAKKRRSSAPRLPCEVCGIKVKRTNYDRHMKNHTGDKNFQCDTCGACFVLKTTLRRHLTTHMDEKPFICDHDECGKRFKLQSYLARHIVTVHRENQYKCRHCHKCVASSPGRLKLHEKRCRGDKDFSCPYAACEKAFLSKTALNRHMKTHSGDKPHKCEYCDRTFSQKGNMLTHIRTHTGEKPYTCEVCGEGFSHNVTRKGHMKKHE